MLWMPIVLIVAILVSLYFLIYLLGKNKILISFVRTNEIEFRKSGENIDKIMPNVQGKKLKKTKIRMDKIDSKGKIISSEYIEAEKFFPLEEGEKKKSFFGLCIYWIGLPPYRQILKWKFSWDKSVSEGQKKDEEEKGRKVESYLAGDQFVSHASEKVSSLYYAYTYPIMVKGVEIVGQITIDIYFNVKIETVIPSIPVPLLRGNWFVLFSSLFKGIISDHIKKFKLEKFEKKVDKNLEFSVVIDQHKDRFVSTTGMQPSEVVYTGYQVSGSEEVRKASTAGEVARLEGERTKNKALADAFATKESAKAEEEAIKRVESAKAIGLKTRMEKANKFDGGMEVLRQQIMTEATTGFQGEVLSQGGSNIPIQTPVNIEGKNKKKINSKKKKEEDND